MNNFTDQEMAEEEIENSLTYLRQEFGKTSVYRRNECRKRIRNEMQFLKENHPDSYIFGIDMSDISLVVEPSAFGSKH